MPGDSLSDVRRWGAMARDRELTDLFALSSVPSRDDESMFNIITICYGNETKEKARRT